MSWNSAFDPKNDARRTASNARPRKVVTSADASTALLKRAKAWLAEVDPAIEGQGGSKVTFRAACELAGRFKLSRAQALELLEHDYNPRCKPVWSRKELEHKVDDAIDETQGESVKEDRPSQSSERVRREPEPEPEPEPPNDYEHSDSDAPDAPPPNAETQSKTPERVPDLISTVLDEWATSGPLVHEATGIARLDELTAGGPTYGTRWVLIGAPDAGKTATLLQIGHTFAQRNISVGLMAVDEESGDLVTRLAQRVGYARQHCEVRDPLVLADMRTCLAGLPIYFYDATWTIENAAADLANRARATGSKAMLGVDSIQTVHCLAESVAQREMSEVSAVTARMHALRSVATRYRLIAIATSEMGRGAYRSNDPSQQSSTLASAKWSGSVEYSARVLLGLRSVAGETDLVELEMAKNKHGPRDERFHLRIDRRCQMLTPTVYDAPPPPSSADRDEAARDKVTADALLVARVLSSNQGINVRELRSAAKAAHGFGVERVNAAVARLGDAVVKGAPNKYGAIPMSLDESQLPEDIRTAIEGSK